MKTTLSPAATTYATTTADNPTKSNFFETTASSTAKAATVTRTIQAPCPKTHPFYYLQDLEFKTGGRTTQISKTCPCNI